MNKINILLVILSLTIVCCSDVNGQDTLPFDIVNNHIAITLKIQGEDRNMFLDLGSMANAIPSNWLSKDKPIKTKSRNITDPEGNKSFYTITKDVTYSMNRLQISNTHSAILDQNEISKLIPPICCSQQYGILGSEYFLRRNEGILIDLKHKKIILYGKLDKPISIGGITSGKLKYQFPIPLPMFQIVLDEGIEDYYYFDTGFSGCLSMTEENLERMKSKNKGFKTYKALVGQVGGKNSKNIYRFSEVRINNFNNMRMNDASIIQSKFNLAGMEWILSFDSILINLKEDKMEFIPKEKMEKIDHKNMDVEIKDHKFYLKSILLTQFTENAILGEEVGAINGYNLQNLVLDSCCSSSTLDSLCRSEIRSIN